MTSGETGASTESRVPTGLRVVRRALLLSSLLLSLWACGPGGSGTQTKDLEVSGAPELMSDGLGPEALAFEGELLEGRETLEALDEDISELAAPGCGTRPNPDQACVGACGSLSACTRCACDSAQDLCVVAEDSSEACCLTDEDCSDGDPSTLDRCPAPGASCEHPVDPYRCDAGVDKVILRADWNSSADGIAPFAAEDLDDPGPDPGPDPDVPGVAWRFDDSQAFSGGGSLFFGEAACHSLYSGALGEDCQPEDPAQADVTRVLGAVRSPVLDLDAACVWALVFRARFQGDQAVPPLDGEEEAPPDAAPTDELVVRVLPIPPGASAGSEEDAVQVFSSAQATAANSTDLQWRAFAVDLTPWQGQKIQLLFAFDSKTAAANDHPGVWVDELVVRTVSADFQCGPATPCPTVDPCAIGRCLAFSPPAATPGAPTMSPAALGLCEWSGFCPSCATAADCDPPAPCEEARCSAGLCTPWLDPGCCREAFAQDLSSYDFDADMQAWELVLATSLSWRRIEGPAYGIPEGGAALGLGPLLDEEDTALLGEADEGLAASTLRSPLFEVPPGPAFRRLGLRLAWPPLPGLDPARAQAPQDASDERLRLFLIHEDIAWELWSGTRPSLETSGADDADAEEPPQELLWAEVALPLDAWRDQQVRVALRYEAGAGAPPISEDSPRVLVDDVALSIACAELCASDEDCVDLLPCTEEACLGGECAVAVIGTCCASDEDCEDTSPCTTDLCEDGLCAYPLDADPTCCAEGVLPGSLFDFESGMLPGFVSEVPEGSPLAWHVRDDVAASGLRSLWFGDIETDSYLNPGPPGPGSGQDLPALGSITFPSISLPAAGTAVLRFSLRLDTEWKHYNKAKWEIPGPGLLFDRVSVEASASSPGVDDSPPVLSAPVEIWNSFVYEAAGSTCSAPPIDACAWQVFEASLAPFAGQQVSLRLTFDSFDGHDNAYGGPWFDDVAVDWHCATHDCYSSLGCDDPKDNLDICTKDKCIDRQCIFEKAGISGVSCCSPVDKQTITFEAGDNPLTIEGGDEFVTWRARSVSQGGAAHTGSFGLIFNDPESGNYANPAGASVAGAATWLFDAPPFEGYVLEWWQRLDLDEEDQGEADSDRFTVSLDVLGEVAPDGEGDDQDPAMPPDTTLLFDNKPLYGYYGLWRRVRLSLDPWMGKSLRLTFAFDSGDGFQNEGAGVAIDDLTTYKGCD